MRGRGVLARAAIAGVLTVGASAGAVSAAVVLQIRSGTGDVPRILLPGVTRAEAGDPHTFLILGSDARYGDRKLGLKPRSDTLLLVRVDPDLKRVAVMSLPRDLKVRIPGYGTDKINAAYADGGPGKTLATVKQLFRDATGRPFDVNGVINVNFAGFRRAVDYAGGVYVDVDRRYYNDNSTAAPGQGYATIDVQPGYQKLKGQDALDYVRYRHGDSDLFRASRQQDFLRQVAHQDGVKRLLDPSKVKTLARIFGRYFEVDKHFLDPANLIGLAKTGAFLAGNHAPVDQVKFPAYEAPNPAVDTYLYVKPDALKRAYDEFMNGSAPATPAAVKPAKKHKARAATVTGLEAATSDGENMAVLADPKLGFPFYFPARRLSGSRYTSPQPRLYSIDGHQAYRLVLSTGLDGEYYGVQGTTWKSPPILDDPDATKTVDHRKLQLYYDGSHLRLVAWTTPNAVYWVTNTLDESIANSRLLAIAGSLKRLKQ